VLLVEGVNLDVAVARRPFLRQNRADLVIAAALNDDGWLPSTPRNFLGLHRLRRERERVVRRD